MLVTSAVSQMLTGCQGSAYRIARHAARNGLLLALLSGFAAVACQAQADAKTSVRGRELFETCAECHGNAGQGNPDIGAPNIAGMPAWYIETELRKFRGGIRGAQFDDIEGMRMRAMALSLPTDEDVPVIAQYVASLAPVRHAPVLGGDPNLGKRRYAVCGGCHGSDGRGNSTVKAPRIAGLDDWYLVTELKKFKGNVRGADPRDEEGSTMAPMAKTLANEKMMRDVAAYVSTLKPRANSETQSQ